MDNSTTQPDIAAWVGIDWADQKHEVVLLFENSRKSFSLDQTPEAIDRWATEVQEQFPGRTVAVCLEQAKGALIYALMKYECFRLFPINPKQLASYRDALSVTGAKDDPTDARLLAEFIRFYHDRLIAWKPDDEITRLIAMLGEDRRVAVDQRTELSNRLRSLLKCYFPLALRILGETLHTKMACEFLLKWPSLEHLQRAREQTVRKFYYAHNCRGDVIEERLKAIRRAHPLVTDRAILDASITKTKMLAGLLLSLFKSIADYDRQLKKLMASHPDAPLFTSLPGAGDAMSQRLLAAFGTNRDRFASAQDVQNFSGISPVTKRSGKMCIVHKRWACPNFIRQTFHEYAGHSRKSSAWAKAYYDYQRAIGKKHHTAIRALGFKWIRIIYCCWKNRTPYDEQRYIDQLRAKNSPILPYLPRPGVASCG